MTTYNLQTRCVPAQAVATLTRRVTADALPETIGACLAQLHRHIAAQGGHPDAAPFVVYHGMVNTDSDGPIEVCQPYTGPLTPTADLTLRVEPEHTEAFVTLRKAQFEFPAILGAYDAAAGYAAAHGVGGPLSPREVYPHRWDALTDTDPAGDVAWPFTPR